LIRTINALLHAVGLDASLIGTLLLSLSTIAGTEISNPSWVNFQSAGWVSFQSAPTINGYSQEKGLSLRQGTIVDATIIHAPSSTKNEEGKRDPEMYMTKKGNQYYFGMKAPIGADVELGLVHHVHGTAANVANVTQVAELLHSEENAVYADAGL
jgi:hypothetical protein